MADAGENKSIHTGHRKRAKGEFLARGLEGMPDHKVLELLLFYAIPQGDVNPLAHRLLDRFGSLSAVFNATHEQLTAVPGVGENTAILIKLTTALGSRYLQDRVNLNGVFRDGFQFKELLLPYFFGARSEMAYLVCLNSKNKLIGCYKLSEGTTYATSVAARNILERALSCNAASVVLAHNHLCGLASPSREDIAATRHLFKTLREVGIYLQDHYVVCDDEICSMRESGCLSDLEDW